MNAYEKVQRGRGQKEDRRRLIISNGFLPILRNSTATGVFSDDGAVIAGIAKLENLSVTVIGIEKGHSTKEKVRRNFGSAHPEGYRKALRQMKLAEKFRRPVVCFVDTAGAYCGVGAEERGQGQAIAENLMEMMSLKVPVVSVFIGEGGSGGALALAVADEVWMLENSVYSVISPEGCASILWKDSSRIKEASECLRLTAEDLYSFGVIERIVPEKDGFDKICSKIKDQLFDTISLNRELPVDELLENRYRNVSKNRG